MKRKLKLKLDKYLYEDKLTIEDIIKLLNKHDNSTLDDNISIQDYFDNKGIQVRICSNCNHLMISGCIIGNGYDYYCSEECLALGIPDSDERRELFECYSDENYWTDWE